MNADLMRLGGVLGTLGLSALMVAPRKTWRLGALGTWAVGCGLLAISLAPSGHHRAYAAAAVAGLVFAALLALLFLQVPWTLAVAVLACAPARIPVTVGATKANLLLPLYAVVAGATLALAWSIVREPAPAPGAPQGRPTLGAFARPAALLVAWLGIGLLWSNAADKSLRAGAVDLVFYVLPLGLLAVSLSRLRWDIRWVKGLYVQLAGMALVFAVIGADQYLTRNIYWNPKVEVDNAYAPVSWYYRVNSIFYDPSIYGRFLVVAILASVVLMLFARGRALAGASIAIVVTLVGLLPSFSQSSFVSLAVGVGIALIVLWRWKAALALAAAVLVVGVATLGVPQLRHRIVGKASFSRATGTRSALVSTGVKLAIHHPVIGVGTGGYVAGYAKQALDDAKHPPKKKPKGRASHDAVVTVAAENGLPGVALLLWLLVAVVVVPFRRNRGANATDRARLGFGLALLATVVHSLFYNALLEDPLFWALLALSAVAFRESEPAPDTPVGTGARMIGGWKRALVLAPHTDDGEFGCGGTMARLVEEGTDVRYVAFSIATRSLPEGFAPDTLRHEVAAATGELGIPVENLTVHDFDVRTFPEHRQEILELLIELWNDWQPDVVFQPSLHDIHQDHQAIAAEGLRAFKRTTILGYEIPWNNLDFAYQAYISLQKSHLERKSAALAKYASQQHRRYADPEYVWNLARTHGININREYAEVFQVYRAIG